MRSDLHALYPPIYNGVIETDILADIGDAQCNEYLLHMDGARRNHFVLTADERGIVMFERVLEITADPSTEDLEFRRRRILNRLRMRPPFTFRFLLQRLDDLIGEGKYKAWLATGRHNYLLGEWALGKQPFREPEYTLYIQAALANASWHHEVSIFVNKIKPANIVYILSPMVAQGTRMSSGVEMRRSTWNYSLGGWAIGEMPFLSDPHMEEMIKLPEQQSLTPLFFDLHAQYTADEIAFVRFNGEYVTGVEKRVEGDTATLRYMITPAAGISEVVGIELLRGDGAVLDAVQVFVPVPVAAADQLTFQHSIYHKEGAVANG